jgi:hypothetical protein
MDLGLSNAQITSPPALAQLSQYRPAVSFRNDGTIVGYCTGTIVIVNDTTGREEYSAPLAGNPVQPGSTAILEAAALWYPSNGNNYTVTARVFASNGDQAADITPEPVHVSTPNAPATGDAAELPALTAVKQIAGGITATITIGQKKYPIMVTIGRLNEDPNPPIQYPFYLPD